jgi:hypothetical protein
MGVWITESGHDVEVSSHTTQRQSWRVSAVGRVAGIIGLLGWLALTLVVTIGGNRTPGAGDSPTVILWTVFVVIALGVWRYGFVPYVEATGTELVIRNAFTKRHIPWTQIKAIKPGSMGLMIVKKEGGLPNTAWAVQKGRGARWLKMRTRSDEVTAALMEHVRSAGS